MLKIHVMIKEATHILLLLVSNIKSFGFTSKQENLDLNISTGFQFKTVTTSDAMLEVRSISLFTPLTQREKINMRFT